MIRIQIFQVCFSTFSIIIFNIFVLLIQKYFQYSNFFKITFFISGSLFQWRKRMKINSIVLIWDYSHFSSGSFPLKFISIQNRDVNLFSFFEVYFMFSQVSIFLFLFYPSSSNVLCIIFFILSVFIFFSASFWFLRDYYSVENLENGTCVYIFPFDFIFIDCL